jgi:uncharacterized oxidoreductase
MARTFTDDVALVTGGSSGIGLEIARQLQKSGARVVICGRDEHRLRAAASDIGGALAIPCDICDAAQVSAMLRKIKAVFGHLDVLVNNAGALGEHDFTGEPVGRAVIDRELTLNLTAPLALTDCALPLLRKSKAPAIVFVGSGYGWSPAARAPLYSAAKAGVRSFAKTLRMQLGPLGFTILEVVPPTVDTPATTHRAVAKIRPEKVAALTLDGVRRGAETVFAGQARLFPIMLRLAPGALERAVGRS